MADGEKNRQNRNKWMQEKMFIKSDFDPTKAAEKSPQVSCGIRLRIAIWKIDCFSISVPIEKDSLQKSL